MKSLLNVLAGIVFVACLMFASALYGSQSMDSKKLSEIALQCNHAGQFVIKRSIFKCERVKNVPNQERQTLA